MLDILASHGVNLVIGLTSLHPLLKDYVRDDSMLANRLAEVKVLLSQLADKHKAPFLDYSGVDVFGCTPDRMWDLIHLPNAGVHRFVGRAFDILYSLELIVVRNQRVGYYRTRRSIQN